MAKLTMDGKEYNVPVEMEKKAMEMMFNRSNYLDISVEHFKKHAKYIPEKDELDFDDFECAIAYSNLIAETKFLMQVEEFKRKNLPKMSAILHAILQIEERGRAKARRKQIK